MRLTKIITEGQEIPLGYGLVGKSWAHYRGYEILPIPLNYLKRWWYHQVAQFKPSDLDKKIQALEEEGYKRGYKTGYEQAPIDLKRLEQKLTELSKLTGKIESS